MYQSGLGFAKHQDCSEYVVQKKSGLKLFCVVTQRLVLPSSVRAEGGPEALL